MLPIGSSIQPYYLDKETDQDELRAKGQRINTPFVISKFLQQSDFSNGASCLATFQAKGGTLVNLNPLLDTNTTFTLEPRDTVYTSCSAGFRRSQTLWNLLLPYAKSGSIRLPPPHATRYGCDPYNGKINWHENIEEEHKPGDEFELWSGRSKAQRLGFDQIPKWEKELEEGITDEKLASITEYYNEHYYSTADKEGRCVFMTYLQNTHIHLYRLIHSNPTLKNVTVVHFDLEDFITKPRKEWKTYRASKEAYQHFAELLEKAIDFSRLKR